MVSKIFILGRTGSGKSTSVRFLTEEAQHYGWTVEAFNDYPILRAMYETDTEQRFRATEHDGFEVLDLSVYDEAISRLVRNVQSYRPTDDKTLLTIEFTSNNYARALERFDDELVRNARFMFISADLKTCLERVSNRMQHPITRDDYFVIDNVLLRHYPSPYMPLCFNLERTQFIYNMGSLDELRHSINSTAFCLFEHDRQPHLFALA